MRRLTVAQRLLGLAPRAVRESIAAEVQSVAAMLRIESLLARKPAQLSGGQKQRVALARAMVRRPRVFLMDEPLSNLDAELRVHMRIELARLHKELKTTIIYVTHDQVEAMTLADKIVVLRDGSVAQAGTPLELYDDPDNLFVAGFIGSPKMNFLPGVVEDGVVRLPEHGGQTIPLTAKAAPGTAVTVGIRPEHFKPGGTARLELGVEMIEHLGAETYAYARRGAGELLTVATQGDRSLKAGDALSAEFDPARALLFDAGGQRLR
jgi:lactose/L-arabinose transport system ATP-binding protein